MSEPVQTIITERAGTAVSVAIPLLIRAARENWSLPTRIGINGVLVRFARFGIEVSDADPLSPPSILHEWAAVTRLAARVDCTVSIPSKLAEIKVMLSRACGMK
jgi:hypothetical protein